MASKTVPEDGFTNGALITELEAVAKDAALLHGILMRTKESPNSPEVASYFPFTLFPSPVPKVCFDQAVAVQTHFNRLVDKVSQDSRFLEEALASTIKVDDFIARLFDIYTHVLQEGCSQPVAVGLNRSDYMLDQGPDGNADLKQIEINTIAVGCGGVSSRLPALHRHILRVAGRAEEQKMIQDNNPVAGIAKALAMAWKLYDRERESASVMKRQCSVEKHPLDQHSYNDTMAVVMFLVADSDLNIYDHRCVENELWNRGIPVIRRRFVDVCKTGSLDQDKRLFIDGQEVAIVYFRSGFMPQNYTEQGWGARLMVERSLALKCPDIATHLAGTKKVQQEENVLGEEGDKSVAMALANPDQYVLKPQREGGGNNVYGADIRRALSGAAGGAERTAYILMDRVRPRPFCNYLLRGGCPLGPSACVSELGVFGAYVRQGTDMLLNECVGHLLRTKSAECPEGSVFVGAALDTPLLV